MKKWLQTLTLSTVAVLALSACGTSGDDNSSGDGDAGDGEATEPSEFKVGMVTDVGGIDDKSFNQSAWEGLQAFGEEQGLEENTNYQYIQSGSIDEFEPNLRELVRADFDLSWGIGFLMEDAIRTVASQNEDSQLAIVDTVVADDDGNLIPNIANITFKEHEGSFLVGVVAGMRSESNKVAFLGGVEGELIKKFENGFKAGVMSVNPDAEIEVQYVADFNDPTRAQQIANTMYSNGTDIIYHAAGDSGNGVFTEAINRARNDENVWVIGVDRDQYEEGVYEGEESVTLTSMVKRTDQAVQIVSEDTMNGNFPGGEVLEFGLDDEAIDISESEQNLTDEDLSAVEDYKAQIANGEIEVPKSDEEYEAFLDAQ
ncbi:BMP family lipoprotein [Alkalicoccobacillus murimartini]|uniref:Basic membrane protein A n=1 Tax=Alkalicoccobacillus murimartini TaxID=171685 RepID=A0ABT9YKM9_9BACI|nr:BMP family ABC transporter substrate-binding protein [Alkalicoccobacillus murimartini]MDQ0208431.1 basic membrane protein A [Alkalicoccobacillus murimartini]